MSWKWRFPEGKALLLLSKETVIKTIHGFTGNGLATARRKRPSIHRMDGIKSSEDLPRIFHDRLDQLRRAALETWAQEVSGKYVLERFYDLSPLPNNFRTSHLWVFYMESCASPPSDLVNLLDRVIKHARE
jgi:hypothetical protein